MQRFVILSFSNVVDDEAYASYTYLNTEFASTNSEHMAQIIAKGMVEFGNECDDPFTSPLFDTMIIDLQESNDDLLNQIWTRHKNIRFKDWQKDLLKQNKILEFLKASDQAFKEHEQWCNDMEQVNQ